MKKHHLKSLSLALLCGAAQMGYSQLKPVPATPIAQGAPALPAEDFIDPSTPQPSPKARRSVTINANADSAPPSGLPESTPVEMNETMRQRYGLRRGGEAVIYAQDAAKQSAEAKGKAAEAKMHAAESKAQAAMRARYGLPRHEEHEDSAEDLAMVKAFTANIFGGSQSRSRAVLVGSFSDEQLQETEEDMTVMSRIFEKASGKQSSDKTEALGIVVDGGSMTRTPNSLYLEGYGPVFFVKVNFPLAPPPDVQEEKTSRKESTSWETAKKELYGSKNSDWPIKFDSSEAPEFNSEKVSNLQDSLVSALKESINIRGLKGDDKITVIVSGPPVGIPITSSSGRSKKRKSSEKPTTLTLQVAKSAVEQLTQGKIDDENFRKKMKINSYYSNLSGGAERAKTVR